MNFLLRNELRQDIMFLFMGDKKFSYLNLFSRIGAGRHHH
jgi:hypothetical protein